MTPAPSAQVAWKGMNLDTGWKLTSTRHHLVGGFNHLEKYESQWEGLSHILWKKSWKPPTSHAFIPSLPPGWLFSPTGPPELEHLLFHLCILCLKRLHMFHGVTYCLITKCYKGHNSITASGTNSVQGFLEFWGQKYWDFWFQVFFTYNKRAN